MFNKLDYMEDKKCRFNSNHYNKQGYMYTLLDSNTDTNYFNYTGAVYITFKAGLTTNITR